ncbi:XVIPCD domain-containing protein [Xanthomonas campestris pv. campestris]|uniref:XVIPCD domain-containing protein n=1 Tax=Xanthomonas campestris TaxID=339 RepID=UPI00226AA00C|nr:XVIPCD domain-containing protein [Xanthomonas campestris]MEB1348946.1 XVIPCD domain-containing protein [Xanthomonas campestris pv. campestris]
MASTTEIAALLSATDAQGRVDPMAYEAQRLILQHQGLGSVDAAALVHALPASPGFATFDRNAFISAIDQRLETPQERQRFAYALDQANLSDSLLERLGERAFEAGGQAYDATRNAASRAGAQVSDGLATAQRTARHPAADPGASPALRAAANVGSNVIGEAQQGYGFVTGGATHALSTLSDTVDLARMGVRLASDPNYRDVVVGMVRIYAAEVAADPHKPIDQVRSAVTQAWQHWEQGLAQAQRDGREREYIGSAAGAAGVEILATLVPASKVSKLGKAAQIMEDIAPRAAAEASEGLADAARAERAGARAHDGTEYAPERHAGLPGRARAYAEGLEEVGQAARRGGEAGEGAQQMLRGLVGQARQDGHLDDLVRAARATDNVEGLLRSGQLEPHELTAILKRTPGVFDGRIDFPTALDHSTQGVDLTRLTTRQLGDIGEAIQTHDLVKQGYSDIVAIKNRSGHGIDLVGRNPDGDLEFFEIKTSAKGLAPAQHGDPEQFVAKRLERAIDAQGHWDPKNTIPGLKSIAQDISREIGPEAENINATWVRLNLSRSPDAPHLQIERKIDPWGKPAAPKQTMLTPGDADHPDHAAFDTILRTVQGDGRWNVAESHNIAASLLKEYKADPLCKTLDSVRIGGSADTPCIFAVSSPHGDKAPHFHVRVEAEQAAQRPAAESFAQVQQLNQQQALAQETEQQNLAQRGPRMS